MNMYALFFIALIPIVWLIVSLGVLKMPAHKTCSATLVLTIILAIMVWKMPVFHAVSAALEGVALALWPIMIVIIAAVFTYNLSLHTKSMDIIKKMLSNITTDKRILVLIIAWGFGGFLEAVAGYGTAVAIPASILAAMGFEPLFAAIICLIANTVPTAFGAIGIPISTMAKLTGLDVNVLSYYAGLQLFPFIILITFILVVLTTRSVKGIKGVFGVTLVSGVAFAVPELLSAKYMGAELPSLIGSVCSMAATIIVTKIFYKNTAGKSEGTVSSSQAFKAWLPYILIFIFMIFSSKLFPNINHALSTIKTSVKIYTGQGAEAYVFKWIATPGTLIIIAAFIGGMVQGAKFSEIVNILFKTINQMTKSAITVISIVALAKVMGYSGMINSIATVLAIITGSFYPFIAPIIGALGTFVTGSDTSSNVLFGKLQVDVANSIGVNATWLAAGSATGATAGKMISPQSIAVATAATGLAGAEGKILNKTIKFCIGYVVLLGVVVYIGSLIIKM
ncbi:L-lactate permease [Clostridium sp. MB40-C1]|uniref:L-lactate permease n=1 Tax=Clostridium sp. MB40-C1 TaxID=3070996 RepID=UPI0027E050EA|nr:L-lactate permease [Clostridium sp. MB40-C1]WMJ80848.1 L-lactate permease [Clostridium sp. MB40-C1]